MKLAQVLRENPDFTPESAANYLRWGPAEYSSYPYDDVLRVSERVGWDAFTITGDRRSDMRTLLGLLARSFQPFWARMSPLGRAKVGSVIEEDTYQCLSQAGLMDSPPDPECVSWWDSLARTFRDLEQQALVEIGREAELLSLKYESDRLANDPALRGYRAEWVGFEDNTKGFDISSWVAEESGAIAELKIEVKGISGARRRFYLTKNEWTTATDSSPLQYVFHVWLLDEERLLTFAARDLEPHIPVEAGFGLWIKAEIRAFWASQAHA